MCIAKDRRHEAGLGNENHGGGCHSARADFHGSDMPIWTDSFSSLHDWRCLPPTVQSNSPLLRGNPCLTFFSVRNYCFSNQYLLILGLLSRSFVLEGPQDPWIFVKSSVSWLAIIITLSLTNTAIAKIRHSVILCNALNVTSPCLTPSLV